MLDPQDLVNTSQGTVTIEQFRLDQAAKPTKELKGVQLVTQLQRQFKRGELTSSQYDAMSFNALKSDDEPAATVESFDASKKAETDRVEFNAFSADHDGILDTVESIESKIENGVRINPLIMRNLDQMYMDSVRTGGVVGLAMSDPRIVALKDMIVDIKYRITQSNANVRAAR